LAFNAWRVEQIGREPKASTLNTRNSAMNKVYAEAVSRGFISQGKVPILANKGEGAKQRPDFSLEDYRTMIRKLPSWITKGKQGKSQNMRVLLRDYVLIMANTGMRHGTEAQNLRWKHVTVFTENSLDYVEFYLHGKTAPHEAIGRSGNFVLNPSVNDHVILTHSPNRKSQCFLIHQSRLIRARAHL
jgi:integrase